MYEYKVVNLDFHAILRREKVKIIEVHIEAEINRLAKQGWRLISTSIDRDASVIVSQLFLFFERETGQSN